jgi:protein-disulfide isomerase
MNPRRTATLAALGTALVVALPPLAAHAGGPCDRLKTKEQRALVEALLGSQHPYDCCDETIAACLRKPKVCKLARRLRDDICRRVERGQDRAAITRALQKRAESMTPLGKPPKIDLRAAAVAGEPSAPVTLVVYACARCPYCARSIPQLYRAVTEGALRGKVKLYLRIFPIRSHKDSTPANLALQAAHRLGGLWPYLLQAYGKFDSFSPARLPEWARAAGLDVAAFNRALADPAVRDAVVASKKEGILNKVDATPTYFLSGRRVTADPHLDTILDLLEEELDRSSGAAFCGGGF